MSIDMHHLRIPTIIGLGILLVGLVGAVLLVQQQQQLTSRASQAAPTPRTVSISNITDQSFTVSWVTDSAASGFVALEREGAVQRVLDDRDKRSSTLQTSTTHYVTIENLVSSTTYRFRIGEGVDTIFDQQGQPYEVKTGAPLSDPPSPDSAQGLILTSARTPAIGTMVFLELPGSQRVSSLVTSSGNWIIPLSTVRDQQLALWLPYDRSSTTYTLNVEGGVEGRADAVVTTAGDRPVPPIVLGQSYDFRQGRDPVGIASSARPAIVISVGPTSPPQETEQQLSPSSFDLVSLGSVTSPSIDVMLDNPSQDGEVLQTPRPQFFGRGPEGAALEITIESSDPTTGSVTVTEQGEWSFISPRELAPGDHQITVRWRDAEGILQSLTRSFAVNAQEAGPAFTATPSATPTFGLPTPTMTLAPSVTAVPTPTPTVVRTTQPSTESGTPKPGSLTPSLILLMIGGISTLIGIVFVKRVASYG